MSREGERELGTQGVVAFVVRALIAGECGVDLTGAFEDPRERERRRRVVRSATGSRCEDGAGHAVGDPDERDHVLGVVLEDRRDDRRVAFAQVVEVRVRDEPAGDIRGSTIVQNAFLELTERRRAEAVTPEPPGWVKQVEVRVVHRELTPNGHHKPRSDDREIERLAVVRGARAKRFDLGLEALDELCLRPEVQQHVLP